MERFLTQHEVADRYNTTRQTIWKWANNPYYAGLNFPKPVKLGVQLTRWRESDLMQWEAERARETVPA